MKARTKTPDQPVPAKQAQKLILGAKDMRALAGLQVSGHLNLSGNARLTELPAGLTATSLDLSGCTELRALPEGLRVRRLMLNGCSGLEALPAGLSCYALELHGSRLTALPGDLQVENRLELSGSVKLELLPPDLKVGTLVLRDCVALAALPEGLDVCFLDISGCVLIKDWPRHATLRLGRLSARGCTGLRYIPRWLTNVAQLDVSGCSALMGLPEGLCVSSWVDLAHTGIQRLPRSLQGVQLRWRGVPIDERIAFQPETITAAEVLAEDNLELRRVLMERMGYERFLADANATTLDRDRDAGGERRLLRLPLTGDEDLVCVAVICPSTGRQYMIRVPPTMRSCRQAVAWIAGFDDPDDYQPIKET